MNFWKVQVYSNNKIYEQVLPKLLDYLCVYVGGGAGLKLSLNKC